MSTRSMSTCSYHDDGYHRRDRVRRGWWWCSCNEKLVRTEAHRRRERHSSNDKQQEVSK